MSEHAFDRDIIQELSELKRDSLFKSELIINGPQATEVSTQQHADMLNFCANNYLGLSNHPEIVAAAIAAAKTDGFGLSSVRFICGTQSLHKTLEASLSRFIGTEDCILYSSCFDANGGLFETLLTKEDAIISDQLNHASIIDGIRLCKANRYRYQHNDMSDLKQQLIQAKKDGARHIMIATDGVFSMDGTIANLKVICDLADEFQALVMIDDCHATGFLGDTGRGTHEYCQVLDRVDIITSTLGKALGGASGGFVCSRKPIIEKLRQRSRPYLFSNALAPMISAASIKAIELIESSTTLKDQLHQNTAYFRQAMSDHGFNILPGSHPIVPVMFGDAALAKTFSEALLAQGIFAINFSYPVVPQGQARIRLQISAAHTKAQLDQAINAFVATAKKLNLNLVTTP